MLGIIQKLQAAMKEKRHGILSWNVLLLHDNAQAYTCGILMKDSSLEALSYIPYSSELAFSNYHLFSSLKCHL